MCIQRSSEGFYFYAGRDDTKEMEKVIRKFKLGDPAADGTYLEDWLKRTLDERTAMVDYLWKMRYGDTRRLQRVYRVLECPWRKEGRKRGKPKGGKI